MSLFPAYSDSSKEPEKQVTEGTEWLSNSSFAVTIPSKTLEREEKEGGEKKDYKELPSKSRKRKKEKKLKKKKRKEKAVSPILQRVPKQEIQLDDSDNYFIDKERQTAYLTLKSLSKSLKPRYNLKFPGLVPKYFLYKKMKSKRYYKFLDPSEGCKEGTLEEESIASKKTEDFNKKLADDPHDIETWKEFVKFQDEFYKSQHMKYKSMNERERASAHHKLSILDKAVAQNPENKDLQELWLKIGTSILPSEEMSARIDKILEDYGGTMTLWLGLMTTTQYSLARCTLPAVTQLYEKLLLNFQNIKKFNIQERDFNVLELIFHYGRFLDNCGHWEILWMIIKVNLQFNTKANLNFDIKVEDERVKELENVTLEKEKQAVWQMWSQLEKLREGLHFLPESNSIDYPQRSVSPNTVVNFTWHFHPDLHFQLIVSFLVLLKIPLLPSTDVSLKVLAPNSLPWVYDSPEFILSSVLTSPAVSLHYSYLSPVVQLTRGPQYLRKYHGQLEFLSLIGKTFEACLAGLEGSQKTALGVWWLRFERWIHLLNKLNLISLPGNRKTAKSFFKDFLKIKENRDNLLYYVEYSLLEFNQGNTETCIKTLKTLISSKATVLSLSNAEERTTLASVYRSLVEVLVGTNQRREALDLLINLGSDQPADARVTIHSLASAEKNFDRISTELIGELDSSASCSFEELMMPLFLADWISCYLWLIALSKSQSQLKNCFKKFLSLLEGYSSVTAERTRECLWETIITISWVFERNNLLYIKDILKTSFTCFPQNPKILSFMAEADLQNNAFWWTLKKTFLSSPTTLSCIFLICLALDRFHRDKENFQNRVKNLFQILALQEGKLSSMVHRLRLRFLHEHENNQMEVAQLQALESCPWNKGIYTESILLLPAKLMQLTDVLIEKEFRIHITPDEIQELRD